MNELLLTAFAASLWCLGLWTVTEPGKLLSFLKQPFLQYIEYRKGLHETKREQIVKDYQNLQLNSQSDAQKDIYRTQMKNLLKIQDAEFKHFKTSMKVLNPIILCPVCMGSVHGFITFYLFNDVSFWVIPVMIITSGLNKIWHEKIF